MVFVDADATEEEVVSSDDVLSCLRGGGSRPPLPPPMPSLVLLLLPFLAEEEETASDSGTAGGVAVDVGDDNQSDFVASQRISIPFCSVILGRGNRVNVSFWVLLAVWFESEKEVPGWRRGWSRHQSIGTGKWMSRLLPAAQLVQSCRCTLPRGAPWGKSSAVDAKLWQVRYFKHRSSYCYYCTKHMCK